MLTSFEAVSSYRQSSVDDLNVLCLVVRNVLDVCEKHVLCPIWMVMGTADLFAVI